MDVNIILGKSVLTNVSDVFSGTLSVGYSAYTNNGIYLCKMPISNTTTTPTLDLNTIGAKTIVKNDGSALAIGDLLANGWYEFMYDSGSDKFLCLGGTSGIKVYSALLTQTSTNAPVATILQNTLAGTPVWTRSAQGIYLATLSGAFPLNKTGCSPVGDGADLSVIFGALPEYFIYRESDNVINLSVADYTGAAADDLLGANLVAITVYP